MKKLNRGISYFLYINNFISQSTKKGILFNNRNLALLISNIESKLFLEPEEYFILKNSSTIFDTSKNFITYIEEKTEKSILLSSFIPFEILNAKHYLGNSKYVQKERNSEESKKKSLEYFLYILNYQLKNERYQKLFKNYNFMSKYFSENMIKLLEIMDFFPSFFEDNKFILEYLLRSGEYNLLLAQFILLNSLKTPEMNEEQKNIIFNYFQFLIESSKKLYLVYSVSLFKFLDHIVLSYLEKNKNCIISNFNIFSCVLNLETTTLNGKRKSEIKFIMPYYYIHKNWTELKEKFYTTDLFQKFVEQLNYNNFPKTTVNLLNKFISDYRREYNIIDLMKFEKFSLIKIYYESYSKIEDNGNLLYNYFNDKNLLNKIVKPKSKKILKIEKDFTKICEEYFCYVDKKNWLNLFNYIITQDLENTSYLRKYFFYYKIIEKLYSIFLCLPKDYHKYIYYLSSFIDFTIIRCINRTSLNESGQFFFLLLLKEIKLFIDNLKIGMNKFIEILTKRINNYKFPYLEKYLQIYKFRRIFCVFVNEKILELECLRDICKIYKLNSINNQYLNSNENFNKYLECYRNKFKEISNFQFRDITYKQFYTCFKYHYLFQSNEEIFNFLWKIYKDLCLENKKIRNIKIQILKKKFEYKIKKNSNEFISSIKNLIKKHELNFNNYSLISNLYLDHILEINKNSFEKINLTKSFLKEVKYNLIDDIIFEFLTIAITICQKSQEEKYLTKYLPEIVNMLFKIQISIINSRNTFIPIEFENKFDKILEQIKLIDSKKLKIILPQLLVSYMYENSKLYYLSIELLTKYANDYIDDIAYILASYLVTEKKDLFILLSKSENPKRFENNIIKSQIFIEEIVKNLNPNIKKILKDYILFQKYLKEIFLIIKKSDGRNINENKEIILRIININNLFKNGVKIIVPNLENMKGYKPIVRSENYLKNISLNSLDTEMKDLENESQKKKQEDNLICDNKTLYFCEMLFGIKVLSSKERPAKISFRTCKFHENANDIISKYQNSKKSLKTNDQEYPIYNFLLKGDANDINKELKTFEIFNEINNIFHLKHLDSNYGMSLKRYLISPISCHVVLGEWLENSITFSEIFNFQYGIYDLNQYAGYLKEEKKIKPGFILNEKEIMNVLYQYIDHQIINPNIWYEYQKRYIISTAIWSLTCYLTGLGDRHLGNIMFMKNSGDIVHIDFGYVCGKGLSLPVPEIVHFRYTLNIRRNLGLFEENGIFFFYFYKTFSVFREFFKTLKSQLDYYAFDPYFDNDNSTYNYLISLSSTFNQINDFNSKEFLIELIRKCKDPYFLERMFIGWQPQV